MIQRRLALSFILILAILWVPLAAEAQKKAFYALQPRRTCLLCVHKGAQT